MRTAFVLASLAATLGFAVAQDESCEALNIVEACLPSIQIRIDACETQDWTCLCSTYESLLTIVSSTNASVGEKLTTGYSCYNNCPNDPRRSSVQTQVTQFCAAADAQQPSSTSAVAASSGTPTPTPTASDDSNESASPTESAAQETETGAAGSIVAPAGAALLVVMGFAGML